MGVYIKNMEMPTAGAYTCELGVLDENTAVLTINTPIDEPQRSYRLAPVPPHGRLIDADALRAKMYHEAFETDTPMQKWDSGCWIRYKMFEKMEESAPTIIEADENRTN